jgi:hypothetical protein
MDEDDQTNFLMFLSLLFICLHLNVMPINFSSIVMDGKKHFACENKIRIIELFLDFETILAMRTQHPGK